MSIQAIQEYQQRVQKTINYGGTKKETTIRHHFMNLLNEYAIPKGLEMVPEVSIKTPAGKIVRPDGTLKDSLRQDWGYWESKDEADDLETEIKRKFAKGYPKQNTLFEDSQTAVLYQDGRRVDAISMIDNDKALDQLIVRFISYERPEVATFRKSH